MSKQSTVKVVYNDFTYNEILDIVNNKCPVWLNIADGFFVDGSYQLMWMPATCEARRMASEWPGDDGVWNAAGWSWVAGKLETLACSA